MMDELIQENSQKKALLQLIHELNQPLTVIRAYLGGCELRIERNDLSSDQMLSTLQTIMEHTDFFANQIYLMRKIVVQEDDINSPRLIAEITSLFAFEINEYNIQLKLKFQETNEPTLRMSNSLFKQILFCILKQFIDTVAKNSVQKAEITIQTEVYKEYALNMIIESNFPIDEDDLEKKLTYCRTLLSGDCGSLNTKSWSHGISILLTMVHKESRYA